MSIETNWCFGCKNCEEVIPEKYKYMLEWLKEYKYKIYCKHFDAILVANDNMWIDKQQTCEGWESK